MKASCIPPIFITFLPRDFNVHNDIKEESNECSMFAVKLLPILTVFSVGQSSCTLMSK